jgi:acyl carrier protein
MLDAFDHQFYTYGTLVKDLQNIKRIPGELPLLNIVFNIDQQAPDQGLRFQNLDAYYKTIPRENENFDMFINAASCQDSLVLECQFNEGSFRENTILSWFNSYLEILGIFCENPNTIISSITDLNIYLPIDIKIPETSDKVDSFLSRNLETERLIRKIWSEILLNDNVTETDNFFSIGGHSLLAIELASKIEKDFSKPFSMKDVFENPNIILMAQKVSELSTSISKISTFSPIEIQNLISEKASNSQMQIWYLEEMFPSTTMHNLPAALRIRAKIDIHSLELALNVLKNRHEAFRTYFQVENGVPYQKVDNVDKNEKIKLNIIEANEESIVKILNSEAAFVFNKITSPI